MEGNINERFAQYREAADACFDPRFFSRERILEYAARAETDAEHTALLLRFLDTADDALLRFMWQFYYFQFHTPEDFSRNPAVMEQVAMPSAAEASFPGCIRAVVYLLAVDNLEKWLDEHPTVGRDENVRGYFARYRNMVALNRISHGTSGFCRLSYFLYASAKPYLLRVGRLNYQYVAVRDYCEMYEDKAGGRVFAALPNYTYNARGLQEPGGSLPIYRKEGDTLTAQLFRKDGTLSPDLTELSLENWSPVLKPGDMVATIHIPEGGPLLREDVLASLRGAKKIFSTYFPQYKAIVCQTWFLDPALRGGVILEGSNMAAFADLFDVISGADNNNHSIFEHVFKVKRQPLENLVPTNAFTKRLLDRALRGEKLYWGFGVLKKDVAGRLDEAE